MSGLDALRRHHLAEARAQAEKILQHARQQASEIAAKRDNEARAIVEQARDEGEAAAGLDTDRAWTSARRRARGVILAAQREMYDELRSRVALAIRQDSRFPVLLERLGHAAQRQLGPGAAVEIDRDGDRGVTATRKDRRVEWSLGAIVEAGLTGMGPGIGDLWR
jgi:vacuolar-type H+-ATPase subunit E/Vma4